MGGTAESIPPTCRLYSKVLVIREWVVMKPRPSWNCGYSNGGKEHRERYTGRTQSAGVGEKRVRAGVGAKSVKERGREKGLREKRFRMGGSGGGRGRLSTTPEWTDEMKHEHVLF